MRVRWKRRSTCILPGKRFQMDKAGDHIVWYNRDGGNTFTWGAAFGGGPVTLVEWASTFLEDGVFGQPTLATAEKGKRIFEEAATRLVQFIEDFQRRPSRPRVDHHSIPPTCPLPES